MGSCSIPRLLGTQGEPHGVPVCTTPPASPAPTIQVTLSSPDPPPPCCLPPAQGHASSSPPFAEHRTTAWEPRLIRHLPCFPGFIPTLHSGVQETWSQPKETLPKLQLVERIFPALLLIYLIYSGGPASVNTNCKPFL